MYRLKARNAFGRLSIIRPNNRCIAHSVPNSVQPTLLWIFQSKFAEVRFVCNIDLSTLYINDIWFRQAKQYAEKSDVHDEPDLHAVGYDHSNDDHGDYIEGKF